MNTNHNDLRILILKVLSDLIPTITPRLLAGTLQSLTRASLTIPTEILQLSIANFLASEDMTSANDWALLADALVFAPLTSPIWSPELKKKFELILQQHFSGNIELSSPNITSLARALTHFAPSLVSSHDDASSSLNNKLLASEFIRIAPTLSPHNLSNALRVLSVSPSPSFRAIQLLCDHLTPKCQLLSIHEASDLAFALVAAGVSHSALESKLAFLWKSKGAGLKSSEALKALAALSALKDQDLARGGVEVVAGAVIAGGFFDEAVRSVRRRHIVETEETATSLHEMVASLQVLAGCLSTMHEKNLPKGLLIHSLNFLKWLLNEEEKRMSDFKSTHLKFEELLGMSLGICQAARAQKEYEGALEEIGRGLEMLVQKAGDSRHLPIRIGMEEPNLLSSSEFDNNNNNNTSIEKGNFKLSQTRTTDNNNNTNMYSFSISKLTPSGCALLLRVLCLSHPSSPLVPFLMTRLSSLSLETAKAVRQLHLKQQWGDTPNHARHMASRLLNAIADATRIASGGDGMHYSAKQALAVSSCALAASVTALIVKDCEDLGMRVPDTTVHGEDISLGNAEDVSSNGDESLRDLASKLLHVQRHTNSGHGGRRSSRLGTIRRDMEMVHEGNFPLLVNLDSIQNALSSSAFALRSVRCLQFCDPAGLHGGFLGTDPAMSSKDKMEKFASSTVAALDLLISFQLADMSFCRLLTSSSPPPMMSFLDACVLLLFECLNSPLNLSIPDRLSQNLIKLMMAISSPSCFPSPTSLAILATLPPSASLASLMHYALLASPCSDRQLTPELLSVPIRQGSFLFEPFLQHSAPMKLQLEVANSLCRLASKSRLQGSSLFLNGTVPLALPSPSISFQPLLDASHVVTLPSPVLSPIHLPPVRTEETDSVLLQASQTFYDPRQALSLSLDEKIRLFPELQIMRGHKEEYTGELRDKREFGKARAKERDRFLEEISQEGLEWLEMKKSSN